MSHDPFYQALLQAWEEQKDMPAAERFERMVERGAIDRDGNVLLRYPLPPDDEPPTPKAHSANGVPNQSAKESV